MGKWISEPRDHLELQDGNPNFEVTVASEVGRDPYKENDGWHETGQENIVKPV